MSSNQLDRNDDDIASSQGAQANYDEIARRSLQRAASHIPG